MIIYTMIPTIMAALHRIINGHSTLEHVTSTATSGLLQHYYPIQNFISTPEVFLETELGGFKKPDYTVEKMTNEGLVKFLYVEVKSLVNSNFNDILDQLHDTILNTVDIQGGSYSVFVIVMKGTKIAILHFSSYVSLLEDNNILNYKGFTPVNYILSIEEWRALYPNSEWPLYSNYLKNFNIPDSATLTSNGVESTTRIPYPHIFNLLETNHHAGYIHELFQKTYGVPGLIPD